MEKIDYSTWIGKLVKKRSNKPFKSGSKTELVINITINPYSDKEAFLLNDGSIVNCEVCKLTDNE